MKKAASFLVMGMGVGWVVGLSVTPVVQNVLTSALGIVAGALAGLSTLQGDGDKRENGTASRFVGPVDPHPAALFLVGLAVAVSLGVLARTHHWLEASVASELKGWARLGLPELEVARRLLDRDLPPAAAGEQVAAQQEASRAKRGVGVLFAVEGEECERLRTYSGPRLRNTMLASSIPWAKRVAEGVEDPGVLEKIVGALCRQD